MRFESLEFLRVGTGQGARTFALGPGVNLVLGDNEAGKSTARRAIEALLFGPTKELALPQSVAGFECAGTVDTGDGTRVRLHRRGRNLVTPAPASLAKWLDSQLAGRFHDLFGLDHENLRARDASFLGAEGTIGSLLFGARTGLAPDVLTRLITDLADGIAKAGGERKNGDGLGNRLRTYEETKARRDAVARFEQYNAAVDADARARAALDDQQQLLKALQAERSTLVTLRAGLTPYEEWQRHRDDLERLSTPRAPATREQAASLQQHRARLQDAMKAHEVKAQEVTKAADALARAPLPARVVELLAELDPLAARADRIDGERDAQATDLAEQQEKTAELARTIASLGGDATTDPLAAAAKLIRPAPVRAALQQAVDRHATLSRKLHDARATADATERRAAEARRAADASPVADLSPLERAVLAAGLARHDAQEAVNARASAASYALFAEEQARALGFAHLTPDERARLPQPDRKRVEAVRQRLNDALTAVTRDTKAEKAARTKRDAARLVADTTRDDLGGVPDTELLRRTQLARDAKWQELQAFWTPTLQRGAEGPLQDAARDFETLLRAYDALLVQRLVAGEAIGRLRAAELAEQNAASDHAATVEALQESRTQLAALEAEWTSLWTFLAHPPDTLAEWFKHLDKWSDQLRERALALDAARDCDTRAARHLANVRALVGNDVPAVEQLNSADVIHDLLEERLGERKRANKAAEGLRTTAELTARNLVEAREALARLVTEQEAWSVEWTALVADLPDGIGPQPVAVSSWLDRQKELEEGVRTLGRLATRLADRRARIEAHDHETTQLLARARALEPSLAIPSSLAPRDAFAALQKHADGARAEKDERTRALADHERALRDRHAAEVTLGERRAAIDVTWAGLGLHDPWDLAALEQELERAERADALRQQLAQAARAVDAVWRPDRETFVARLGGRGADDLAAALTDVDTRIEARNLSLDEARKAALKAAQGLEALDATHDALATAQAFEQARDGVLDKADDLLRLRVAKLLLEEARRRAADGSSDLQARATRHLAMLTGGTCTALRIDADEKGGGTLVAIDASGEDRKLSELSTGTADQAWLAIRLAAIEQAALDTPFPLLLDDVFVQFDDARTTAALKVLADVSEHVQVILFTHHDHLLDLARAAIPHRLTEVTLPRPDGSARVRTLATGRMPHARPPLPEPEGSAEGEETEAATGRTRRPRGETSVAETLVLELLAASGEPLGKSDLVEAAAARGQELESVWGATIKALVEAERVVKTGDRKGARYTLPTS